MVIDTMVPEKNGQLPSSQRSIALWHRESWCPGLQAEWRLPLHQWNSAKISYQFKGIKTPIPSSAVLPGLCEAVVQFDCVLDPGH